MEKIENNNQEIKECFDQRDQKKLLELGLGVKEIEELKHSDMGGTSSSVFIVETKKEKIAVKRGVAVDPELNSQREYVFLRLLKKRGGEKIAPEPYYQNKKSDILVMEAVEGEPILELGDKDIADIAGKMAFVHKPEFSRPGIPFEERKEATQYERMLEQIDFLEKWFGEMEHFIKNEDFGDSDSLDKIKKAKSQIIQEAYSARDLFNKSSFSLIHYDLSPGNIIRNKSGNILFLDWRQASIGDRAMDIAKLFYKQSMNENQRKTFFDAYLSKIEDSNLPERTAIYYPLIRLASLLWRLRFLNVDVKNNPQLGKNVDVKLVKRRLVDDYEYLVALLK